MTLPLTIDDYLDRLLDALRLDGKTSRRALAEAEDHLRASAEAKMAAGMGHAEAEHAAIADFGHPEQVAGRFNRELLPGGSFAPVVQLTLTGVLVTGVIFIAVGISGALAAVFGGLFGQDFVAQPLQPSEMTAERCADFLRLVPDAADCQSAGITHHFQEIVGYRLTTGVLGVLMVISYFLLRRYWPLARSRSALPRGLNETMGAAAFAVGAVLLFVMGLTGGMFAERDGLGEALSAEIVAIAFLAGYTALLVRRLALRDRPFGAK
jgi:hypothetical protein